MDWSGVLTRQVGGRMGKPGSLGPGTWAGLTMGGSCLPGAPKMQSLHVAWASFRLYSL